MDTERWSLSEVVQAIVVSALTGGMLYELVQKGTIRTELSPIWALILGLYIGLKHPEWVEKRLEGRKGKKVGSTDSASND